MKHRRKRECVTPLRDSARAISGLVDDVADVVVINEVFAPGSTAAALGAVVDAAGVVGDAAVDVASAVVEVAGEALNGGFDG